MTTSTLAVDTPQVRWGKLAAGIAVVLILIYVTLVRTYAALVLVALVAAVAMVVGALVSMARR